MIMEYTKTIGFIAIAAILSSCTLFNRRHHAGAAAEVNGQFLEFAELDAVTAGLTGEDSAAVAEAYIRQWATEILMYDKARDRVDNKELEELVEDYRHSLYAHAYEQHLLQRMSKEVPIALVDSFYQSHQSQYVLKDGIVKGLLVIVPNGAPEMEKLKKYMQEPDEKNIEHIEKFAYRYASGYELFTDEWRTFNQLLVWMPMGKNDLPKLLKQNRQIVLADSVSTYVLQVTDLLQAGEPMPLEYAKEEIEPILLRERTNVFLQEERRKIYDDAVRFKKVRIYEDK